MFKSALAAALAQKLQSGGRIPSAYIERCKRMLIDTFQKVEGNFVKTNQYFEKLFKDTMMEILMFSDQQHHREAKVTKKTVNKEMIPNHGFTITPGGLIVPDGTKL